jgi:hypothetical protein
MKHWFWKTILGWILLFFVILPAVLIPTLYLGKTLGSLYLSETAPAAKIQGLDILRVLSAQAEGDLKPDKLVAISGTMSDVVQRMNTGATPLGIKEIALIDPKGRVLAHNDVTFIAKDAVSPYANDKFLAVLRRPRRDSATVVPLQPYSPALPQNIVAEKLGDRILTPLRSAYPDLFIASYTISSAVYPIDGEAPNAGFIMIVENHTPERFFSILGALLSPVALVTFGSILVAMFFALPVLLLVTARGKQIVYRDHLDDDLPIAHAHAEPETHESIDFEDVPLPEFMDEEAASQMAPHANPSTPPATIQHVAPYNDLPPSVAAAAAVMTPPPAHSYDEILDAIPIDAD